MKRTTKRAAAARRNGRKGGRPRDKLPAAVLAKLGACPTDTIEVQQWLFRVDAEVVGLVIRGEIGAELAANVRASVGAALRAVPGQVLHDLARSLRDDVDELEAVEPGAQPERRIDAARSPALRRNAR